MNKKQGAIVVSIGLSFLLILGGTIYWGVKGSQKSTKQVLAQSTPAPSDNSSSSLNVESSSAVPLGNLMGSNAGNNNTSSTSSNGVATTNQGEPALSSGNTSSSPAATNPSSGQTAAIDPSTFGQYSKYQDSKNALFGDVLVGAGTEATSGKTVAVNYRGWFTNGQMFDQNISSDKPFTFTLGAGSVIPGWEQGIAGMKVGGERLLVVPPAVGYGSTAYGSIPANSLLIFDVKLQAVK